MNVLLGGAEMWPKLFLFTVDENDQIHLEYSQQVFLEKGISENFRRLTIKGNAFSSLIAINACADYFEPKEIDYEWNFVIDQTIQSNWIIGVLEIE